MSTITPVVVTLARLDACPDAVATVRRYGWEHTWQHCNRPDWAVWLLVRLCRSRRAVRDLLARLRRAFRATIKEPGWVRDLERDLRDARVILANKGFTSGIRWSYPLDRLPDMLGMAFWRNYDPRFYKATTDAIRHAFPRPTRTDLSNAPSHEET